MLRGRGVHWHVALERRAGRRRAIWISTERPGGGWLELKRRGWGGWGDSMYVNAFAKKNVVKFFEVKSRDMALEKGFTLSELMLNALGVPSWSKSLSVSVLLVARGASGCAGGASRVFGIALVMD